MNSNKSIINQIPQEVEATQTFLKQKTMRATENSNLYDLDFDFIDTSKNTKFSSPLLSSTIDLSVEDFSLKDQGTEWFENEYNGNLYI